MNLQTPIMHADNSVPGGLAVHRSRKRIAPFRLHIPKTSTEAVTLLSQHRPACIVAGGIDVINRMKAGDEHREVVYVGRIETLRDIQVTEDRLHIGATCTHHQVATSGIVMRAIPALPAVWGLIANPRIRFKGTIGGNLLANHPDYEGSAVVAVLNGSLRFATPTGRRMVSCGEQGESTWLLEAVEVPCNATTRLEYDRSLKGIAGVVLALSVDGNTVRGGRAAVTWAYRGLCCRDLQLEGPLAGIFQTAGAVARDWTAALPEPVSDHLASGKYRRRIIEVQLRRALERAARANRV